MRLTVENGHKLFKVINKILNEKKIKKDDKAVLRDLSKNIYKNLMKPISNKKTEAAKKATIIRQERAKQKIRDAVNLLNLENAKININSVAKKADVSYNTVKKYSYLIYHID